MTLPFTWSDILRSRGVLLLISIFNLCISIFGIYNVYNNLNLVPTNILSISSGVTSPEINNQSQSYIYVYISGAVVKPGVYKIESNSRLYDALNMAGGISSGADTTYISKNLNMASKLFDEMLINVPWSPQGSLTAFIVNNLQTSTGTVSSSTSPSTANSNKINLNTATKSELLSLKGVGETYAQKIIDNRPISNFNDLNEKLKLPKNLVESLKNQSIL